MEVFKQNKDHNDLFEPPEVIYCFFNVSITQRPASGRETLSSTRTEVDLR